MPDSEAHARGRIADAQGRVFRTREQTRRRFLRDAEEQYPHGDRGGRIRGRPGLVTIEDLVRRSSSEIRDEHGRSQVIKENDHSYITRKYGRRSSRMELLGVRPRRIAARGGAGNGTGGGGKYAKRAGVTRKTGLRFEVLDSTDRRVERVRVAHGRAPADEADIVAPRRDPLARLTDRSLCMAFRSGFVYVLGHRDAGKSSCAIRWSASGSIMAENRKQLAIASRGSCASQRQRSGAQVILLDTPGVRKTPTARWAAR